MSAIVKVKDGVLADGVIGVLDTSTRIDIRRRYVYCRVRRDAYCRVRRDAYCRVVTEVGTDVHTVSEIDPEDPTNM